MNEKKNTYKKSNLRVITLLIASFILLIILAAGIYIYRCTHYWQTDYKNTKKAGFEEKQIALDDGSIINYVEGSDNGIAKSSKSLTD